MNIGLKWITGGLLLLSAPAWAQEKPVKWDLRSCIEYARAHNIQIKKSRLALEESQENTLQAKAGLLPSLSFSTGHNLVNRPKSVDSDKNSYTADYGFNSSVAIYNGGKLRKSVQLQELQNRIQELTIHEAENNIELAITEAFVQVLYATEAIKINENTVEVARNQLERTREFYKAGATSRTDVAQMESQYSSDKYQSVVARTTLDNAKLQLKQLLELGISDDMQLMFPQVTDEEVLTTLPSKVRVYEMALGIMPQMEYSSLDIDAANLEQTIAKAGYLPTLKFSAGIGMGHGSGYSDPFATQLKNSFNESIGFTLNIPIFSNRSNRTAVNLARLNVENSQLNYQSVQKDLLISVETAYQNAVSYQDRFRSASENLKAVEQTFELTEQQFNLGMKNTLELLTEKNNLLSAQQEVLQAKYMTVLNQQLLNFYQGKQIEIK